MQEEIKLLKKWVDMSNHIVFFGGAGVSTESGIPDFRSTDGLYHTKYAYPPETILSHHFFLNKTNEFFNFYRDKMIYKATEPNITHLKLQELEVRGKLTAVITQNIDGLHQKAGSNKVLELHGSVLRNYCMTCGRFYDLDYILQSNGVPICECGGIIKPDVVLYEESLDEKVIKEAIKLISNAELLIVGGTSLSVYPAAGLIDYYEGNQLVLINKTVTQYDRRASLSINEGLGNVFSYI